MRASSSLVRMRRHGAWEQRPCGCLSVLLVVRSFDFAPRLIVLFMLLSSCGGTVPMDHPRRVDHEANHLCRAPYRPSFCGNGIEGCAERRSARRPLATDLSIGTGQSPDTAAETNDHERQTESKAARIAEVAQLRAGATPPAPRTMEAGRDRSFRPDYSRALSVGQMEAAWQREIERLFPSLMAGGG